MLGIAAGAGAGAGTLGATTAAGAALGLAGATGRGGAAFFVAAFLAGAFLGADFLTAAFLTAGFFAFFAAAALLAFFAGRAFFFTRLFFAAARFAFACGRFFPLPFFFAMVSRLLGVNPMLESSPEKVRCHLRSTLESTQGIAYAPTVIPNDTIRPLHDVWLRPRRVFRELAPQPIGRVDLALGAAQGIVGFLGYCRAMNAGATYSLLQIFSAALPVGSILGIASIYFMGAIYARLGSATVTPALRRQAIHVLAYSAVPIAVSLAGWVLTALIAGEAAFLAVARPEDEGFVAILLSAQLIGNLVLGLWNVVLQVMGFSEIFGLTVRKALGVWLLGLLVGVLAMLFLAVILKTLLPGA